MKDLHILIVEDDEELAKSLQLFLGDVAQTTVSHDGFEGRCWVKRGFMIWLFWT